MLRRPWGRRLRQREMIRVGSTWGRSFMSIAQRMGFGGSTWSLMSCIRMEWWRRLTGTLQMVPPPYSRRPSYPHHSGPLLSPPLFILKTTPPPLLYPSQLPTSNGRRRLLISPTFDFLAAWPMSSSANSITKHSNPTCTSASLLDMLKGPRPGASGIQSPRSSSSVAIQSST
ncbi:hypothetical protein JAAARDRAFT_154524, partial [Jaapia argillacea MUCL 33604]